MFVVPVSRPLRTAALTARAPSFSRLVDRLFDESFDRAVRTSGDPSATRVPSMDVSESDAAFTVVLDMPGATRESLKVSVEGRRVAVSTAVAVPSSGEDAAGASEERAQLDAGAAAAPQVIYRERLSASYARTVVLPREVDQSASQARFENGVLTLTLSKKVPTGATQLAVD